MKKKAKRKLSGVVAIALVLSIVMISASSAAAASGVNVIANTPIGESIHKKINISDITGEIAEPPMLTSAASSVAEEKEWYEYVYYSTEPVGYYYLNDYARLAFYDPYDYADSLIMNVEDNLTEWSSNNTLQISYTTGNSITDTSGKSSSATSSVQRAEGQDRSESSSEQSVVTTTVEGNIYTYNYGKNGETTTSQQRLTKEQLWDAMSFNEGTVKVGVSLTDLGMDATFKWTGDTVSSQGTVGSYDGEKWNTRSKGYTENDTTTTTVTDAGKTTVISTIANRLTNTFGTTDSSSIGLSTNNSTTVTKTYNAGYFNANGSPLQWKVIKYTVVMPMKYQVEYLTDGEWILGDYSYCMLNTIQGTCRAWMQNNVAYYEHWGTGEAVTWNEFWSRFFTQESLIQAYKNKLYPDT